MSEIKWKHMKGNFFVWRRSDGYVASTDGYMPRDYPIQIGPQTGQEVKFEKLGQFDYWPDAQDCIARNTA